MFVLLCFFGLFFFVVFLLFFGITMKGDLAILAAIFMKLWTVFSIPIQSVSNSMRCIPLNSYGLFYLNPQPSNRVGASVASHPEIDDTNLKGTLLTFKHWLAFIRSVCYGISIVLLLTFSCRAFSGYV